MASNAHSFKVLWFDDLLLSVVLIWEIIIVFMFGGMSSMFLSSSLSSRCWCLAFSCSAGRTGLFFLFYILLGFCLSTVFLLRWPFIYILPLFHWFPFLLSRCGFEEHWVRRGNEILDFDYHGWSTVLKRLHII